MVMKTKCKTYKKYATEERKTSKDYKKRGFISQGNDEMKHSNFFKKKYNKCKK